MNFVKNIIVFLKRIFNKENNIKMIEAPAVEVPKEETSDFKKQLKVTKNEKQKSSEVETLICFGDGLGIQTKINY